MPMKRRIAVLGGGMGSLSAVYWLTSRPGWQDDYEITVYQLGWRLGGKAASGRQRDDHDRSLEHGYHVLLGFYDNAFATMRECYRELGRAPDAPCSAFAAPTLEEERRNPERYAVHRHTNLQIAQAFNGQTYFLPFDLPLNDLLPGDGTDIEPWTALGVALDVLVRIATGTLFTIPDDPETPPPPRASSWLSWMHESLDRLVAGAETAVDRWLAAPAPLHLAHELWRQLTARRVARQAIRAGEHLVVALVKEYMRRLWKDVQPRIDRDWTTYRDWIMQDQLTANLCGILTDDLLTRGFDSVNDVNYVDWWMRHAAVPEGAAVTAQSTLGQFPYDLVFGYRRGDTLSPPGPGKPLRGSPDMEAGTMLRGLFHFLLAYKGAPEWLPQAGFGEILVAPAYEVLKRRGVRFEFFRRVHALHLDGGKKRVERIEVERQATPTGEYDPLYTVKGLPCWPSEPFYDQLVEGDALRAQQINLESWWTPWQGKVETLTAGTDFDDVLLGISVAALPAICGELAEASAAWREMLARVETNRPTIVQAWFTRPLDAMGWTHGTINGDLGTQPINLLTSMDQLLPRESWPGGAQPASVVYYSGAMPDDPNQPPAPDAAYPKTQTDQLREASVDFFERHAGIYFPAVAPGGRFDWSALASVNDPSRQGQARFDAQYWRVNIDPSERYVLSVTGSSAYRLAAGGSGFDNLYLAGDWIQTGYNAGCMEATIYSGIEAARAIAGHPGAIAGERRWLDAPAATGGQTTP
jgi:uncharacterized protein with NAD-binding domain and iron-sulfur cluster